MSLSWSDEQHATMSDEELKRLWYMIPRREREEGLYLIRPVAEEPKGNVIWCALAVLACCVGWAMLAVFVWKGSIWPF